MIKINLFKLLNICLKYLKMKMNIHFLTNCGLSLVTVFQSPSYLVLSSKIVKYFEAIFLSVDAIVLYSSFFM